MNEEANIGWRFLKLEDDATVEKFLAKVERHYLGDGSPENCAAFLRREPGGSRMIFMNRAASELAVKIPVFGLMLRSLHPSLVERSIAGAERMRVFGG